MFKMLINSYMQVDIRKYSRSKPRRQDEMKSISIPWAAHVFHGWKTNCHADTMIHDGAVLAELWVYNTGWRRINVMCIWASYEQILNLRHWRCSVTLCNSAPPCIIIIPTRVLDLSPSWSMMGESVLRCVLCNLLITVAVLALNFIASSVFSFIIFINVYSLPQTALVGWLVSRVLHKPTYFNNQCW